MNEIAPTRDYVPMTDVGMTAGGGYRIAPQNLGEVVKFAEVMSRAGVALPVHLRNNPGACMAVALQALDWQMNPFAVASKSYSVGDRISYEAQLIAAVVNTRSGIKGRLRYDFEGEGATLRCIVTGVLDGQECVYETPTFGQITVKNSPLWKSDPRQQLAYYGARSWARRHCPEVILGVYDRDEASDMKDVTPAPSGFASRLAGNTGGFSPDGVETAIDEAAGASVTQTASDTIQRDEPSPDANGGQHDPECVRTGGQAFIDGEAREAPSDFTAGQAAAWLYGYDQTGEAMQGRQ